MSICHDVSCRCDQCESVKQASAEDAFSVIFDSQQNIGLKTVKEPLPITMSPGESMFINAPGNGKQCLESRRAVRTHVMSDYWRGNKSKGVRNQKHGLPLARSSPISTRSQTPDSSTGKIAESHDKDGSALATTDKLRYRSTYNPSKLSYLISDIGADALDTLNIYSSKYPPKFINSCIKYS